MNKSTATYNATDVFQKWIDKQLSDHPEYWTKSSRAKKRRREYLYRKNPKTPAEVQEVMNFSRWHMIIKVYYLMARKEVIKGKRIRLGHRLGAIQARRISRNFKNKQVNWGETMKQPLITDPVTGKARREKIIYHTSETYCRIAWEKTHSLTNENYYKFVPSQGGKNRGGFQRDFIIALRNNPLLETQFKQFIHELI